MQSFRAAVVQDGTVAFDLAATLGRVEARCREARELGASLAVFPEAFLGGYPKGLAFGTRVGTRSAAGRQAFQRYFEGAIEIPGPETEGLAAIARESGLFLVIGAVERSGGTLYCAAVVLGPDGALLGRRRKVMPTAMERLIWGFGDASTLAPVPTPLGRIGVALCWESYMPLLRTALWASGTTLYCAPTVDDRETWLPSMRHIALEGRCFVLSACQYVTREDALTLGDEAPAGEPGEPVIRGGSCIVSPLGEVLAGPVFDRPAVLVADLDPGALARGKMDFDATGHYARPDLFRLVVETRPQAAVHFEIGQDGSRPSDDRGAGRESRT